MPVRNPGSPVWPPLPDPRKVPEDLSDRAGGPRWQLLPWRPSHAAAFAILVGGASPRLSLLLLFHFPPICCSSSVSPVNKPEDGQTSVCHLSSSVTYLKRLIYNLKSSILQNCTLHCKTMTMMMIVCVMMMMMMMSWLWRRTE